MTSSRPSFQKINYMLRPRKQVERKIIIELFQELQTVLGIDIKDYQYIGLGSVYYYDFILFNKFLKITNMVSLDRESCVRRFEFNKPFDFVKFMNLHTTDFLNSEPAQPDKNRFVWLDYDSKLINYSDTRKRFILTKYILEDIGIVARKSNENDLFILTVNRDIPRRIFANINVRSQFLKQFEEYLSAEYKSIGNITPDSYPYIIQNILLNTFKNNETHQSIKFRKLFSFAYEDTSPMYTLGGIFRSTEILASSISSPFVQLGEDLITDIDVPILTYREKLKLDQAIYFFGQQILTLPSDDALAQLGTDKLGFEIDCLDIKSYLKYYRYYPQYYEGII